MFKFGSIFLVFEKFAKNGISNINQTHVQLKEVIIINELMKPEKVFTVKRRIIIHKIQIRFIRSEYRNL